MASSLEDLNQKLALALKRLSEPKCRQIKDNAGIYYFAQPLQGKVAFVFPGEGAQYQNMLLDLCLHFPEVRSCFDMADRALIHGSRDFAPSELIFPRSILTEAERTKVEKALWEIDGAVEAVLIANRAMWTLLQELKIHPDVIVGHSSGDYSAMLASGIVDLSDETYIETLREWNRVHNRLVGKVQVPEATLIAVAASSSTIAPIIDAVGAGELFVAMDNCPHQTVLVGSKQAAEKAAEHLRRRGVIYEILAFDRPYHSSMFREYAERANEEFFARLPICPPRVETYSCTTAAPYPADTDEIRRLYVAHWVQPVLFTRTIEAMYANGVRFFIEAGPRGNMTAFVSDILRGEPHLAMPANVHRRSGITQINHLVGVLAAQGIGMRPDYLYARRNPQQVSWKEGKPSAPAKPKGKPMKLTLALPPLKVSPRQRKEAPPAHSPQLPDSGVRSLPKRQAEPLVAVAELPQPAAPSTPANASAQVMREYFKGMEAFLNVETQVMNAFFSRIRTSPGGAAPPAAHAPATYPLLGMIVSISPGEELIAIRQLHPDEDLFLRDHALGGPVSAIDPGLRPLVVLPLTMSMEILAEAAAALMPGRKLIGMRNVQAHHWIRVDDAPVKLEIRARRFTGSANEVEVQVRNLAEPKGPTPVVQGIMTLADAYPKPPRPAEFSLTAERRSPLAGVVLYDGRRMFHGPCFQGVVSIDRSGSDGLAGRIETLPTGNLFRSNPNPGFVTDPVALDAAGQMIGFWAAEYLERGFVVFPYHLDALCIYGPTPPAGRQVSCRVKLQLHGNEGIRSNIELAGENGTVWMQLNGWADRRFDPPQRFHRAWIAPREASISESWRTPLAGVPRQAGCECYRLVSLFGAGTGLWKELWASLVLSRRERNAFAELRGPEQRQMEWLGARTAAKDAIRMFVKKHYGLELLPADIEIAHDEHGKPVAQGEWTRQLPMVPELSLSHSDGLAVALAGDAGGGRSLGIDVQSIRELKQEFIDLAFTSGEQRLLDGIPPSERQEWVLRLWCAKESAAKALGRGLLEGPRSILVLSLSRQTGLVEATPQGKLAEAIPDAAGEVLRTYTAREGTYVCGTTFYEKRPPYEYRQ